MAAPLTPTFVAAATPLYAHRVAVSVGTVICSASNTRPQHPRRHRRPQPSLSAAAAAAFAALIALSPSIAVAPPTLAALPPQTAPPSAPTTPASQADLAPLTDKELRDQSRRNTRVSGAASQLYSTARTAASMGNFPAALDAYNELTKLVPSFAPAHSNRANIFVTQGKLAEALPDYTAALQLAPVAPDTWVVLVNRGAVYAALGDVNAAVVDFNAALATGKGDNNSIYANRASCFETQGNYSRALRDYQRAVEANAADVQPWWQKYALTLFQEGRSQESLGILRRVGTRFDVADIHAAMAAIHFSRDELAEAESEWSQVDRPKMFASLEFLETRKWPPKAIKAMAEFRGAARPDLSDPGRQIKRL
jgi:tetratricopeptide (TPR) repeat protein